MLGKPRGDPFAHNVREVCPRRLFKEMAPGPTLEWLVSGSCPDRENFLHRRNGMDTVGDLSGKRHRGTL